MCRFINTAFAVFIITALTATPGCANPKSAARPPVQQKNSSSVKMAKGLSRIGFAIQMGAFSEVKNAERFTARLQVKGIEAFYFKKDNGIYAVRFGDFPTREKARAAAQKLVSEGLIDSFYRALPKEIVFPAAKKAPVLQNTRPMLRQLPR